MLCRSILKCCRIGKFPTCFRKIVYLFCGVLDSLPGLIVLVLILLLGNWRQSQTVTIGLLLLIMYYVMCITNPGLES